MTDKSKNRRKPVKKDALKLTPSETVISFKELDFSEAHSPSLDIMNKALTANNLATSMFDEEYESGSESRSSGLGTSTFPTTSSTSVPEKFHCKRTIRLVFTIDGVPASIHYNLNIKSENPDPIVRIESVKLGEDEVVVEPRKKTYRMSVTGFRTRKRLE
ncbi:unnamed protein product [Bursaphelenchus xylophilus]|uniref:(pine wood nematode) hypothetical protein n=1 Tax=Bursaphelenchus xylophilus TaxID=6326 RepID=A0A1I7S4C5_BURXY|nr:unnamed protein product [Bursaphelenchus xylophilus]CAG9116950.1 unnamed protein product [Bursaphelenchus xylophilus]